MTTPIALDHGRQGRLSPDRRRLPAGREARRQAVARTTHPFGRISLDELNAETSATGLATPRTSNREFFVRSHFPTPEIRASSWRLSVGGEVKKPRRWSLSELKKLPRAQVVATLECAGNSRRRLSSVAEGELRWGDRAVGSAVWQGPSLSTLLANAEPHPNAREVVFSGADKGGHTAPTRRFSRSLRVALADRGAEVLVATEMNGSPLPPEHGGPARLVVPGWYGMAWVKWLTRIDLRRTPFRGYYQTSRYVYRSSRKGRTVLRPVTRLRVKSLVVAPMDGERLARGRATLIRGRAWSGSGPVAQVEVDVGSGWELARVTLGDGPYDWANWTYRWTPSRVGPATVRVRATDTRGVTQPAQPLENDFQYGTNSIHRVGVVVT